MQFTLRWIPFVAWHVCVAAVVLALITLLADANGGSSLQSLAIITVNCHQLLLRNSQNKLITIVQYLCPRPH
jgi:hypothetical protein